MAIELPFLTELRRTVADPDSQHYRLAQDGTMRDVRALVTGGTGSIGRAIVMSLAGRGYTVDFTYHAVNSGASDLEAASGAHAIRLDLAGDPVLDEANYDVLVNSAGVNLVKHP